MKQVCPPRLAKLLSFKGAIKNYSLVDVIADETEDDIDDMELDAAEEIELTTDEADDNTLDACDVLPTDDNDDAAEDADEVSDCTSEVALETTLDTRLEASETTEETTELTPDTALETFCACIVEAKSTQIKYRYRTAIVSTQIVSLPWKAEDCTTRKLSKVVNEVALSLTCCPFVSLKHEATRKDSGVSYWLEPVVSGPGS